jgi:gamma-glutamyl:cysteine ligase YbdK (ATP-grasp superfamily)
MPTPEEIFEQLRVITELVEADLAMFTSDKRKVLRDAARVSREVVQLTIHAVDATDIIAQAIGMSGEQLRELVALSNRWSSAESELRTLLTGVQGAQLARRHQVAKIVARVFMIASQLAKDDAYGDLRSYVEEVKRIKSYERRKRKPRNPETPS